MTALATLELVAGWSAAVPLTLEADGAPIPLTGLTITAELYDRDGVAVNADSDVETTSAAAGEIDWTPDAADLTVEGSPYELRFKLTDVDNAALFVPNAKAVRVLVRR